MVRGRCYGLQSGCRWSRQCCLPRVTVRPASKELDYLWICFLPLSVLGAVFIFIAAAAPNKSSLGATNGLAQLSVSIVRSVGPAVASSLYSLSIDEDHHYMNGGLVYYVTVAIGLCAIWVGSLLPSCPWKNKK